MVTVLALVAYIVMNSMTCKLVTVLEKSKDD